MYSPIWEDIKGLLIPNTVGIRESKKNNFRYYQWAYLGRRMSYEGISL